MYTLAQRDQIIDIYVISFVINLYLVHQISIQTALRPNWINPPLGAH